MEKIKQMLLIMVSLPVICGLMAYGGYGTGICEAAGENYSTNVEAAYGDSYRSLNDDRLAGSPSEAEEIDGVDTSTGHLILSRSDLSLEGTGGMDFELRRYYESSEADLGHATVAHTDSVNVDTVWVHYKSEDGASRSVIVSKELLDKHKKALKDLIGEYTIG